MASPNSASNPMKSASRKKPIVISLCGLPGAGKTYLLHQLKRTLDSSLFNLYEGSEVIAKAHPNGLPGFQALDEDDKIPFRDAAISLISKECLESGKTGIVTGHYSFWHKELATFEPVDTESDWSTYTHILYLQPCARKLAEQRRGDGTRERAFMPVHTLDRWQVEEYKQLQEKCRRHGVLFRGIDESATVLDVQGWLCDFAEHTEKLNLQRAINRLDDAISGKRGLETVVVFDADRTLAPQDTGALWWQEYGQTTSSPQQLDPLKQLFGGPLGYSYTAFRQATLLYEEAASPSSSAMTFDAICCNVAEKVKLYPEMLMLLQSAASKTHIGIVVVTCGLADVWRKVLDQQGLSENVKIIGGGRITDGIVVTAEVKETLVSHLRNVHQVHTIAFGDSPLDLKMLAAANEAIVVVGETTSRSKTMDGALRRQLDNGLRARQLLLPSTVSPRLSLAQLPLIDVADAETAILQRRPEILHATEKPAARLLTSAMRDASISGPALQSAHRHAGHYLALEFISSVFGLEETPISHVQGNMTAGHRLKDEDKTLIVALMRGGEPMAQGIHSVFPLSAFLHAKASSEVTTAHVNGMRNIILVDSVINIGTTVIDFVKHVRRLGNDVRIVVVAGVLQKACLAKSSVFAQSMISQRVSVVALRVSENRFTGVGGTDTGNRLFNTTHLD